MKTLLFTGNDQMDGFLMSLLEGKEKIKVYTGEFEVGVVTSNYFGEIFVTAYDKERKDVMTFKATKAEIKFSERNKELIAKINRIQEEIDDVKKNSLFTPYREEVENIKERIKDLEAERDSIELALEKFNPYLLKI